MKYSDSYIWKQYQRMCIKQFHSLLLEEINFGSRLESSNGVYKAFSIITLYLENIK